MLQCEHCKRPSLGDNHGWVSLRFEQENGDEPLVLIYCPLCAERFRGVDPRAPVEL